MGEERGKPEGNSFKVPDEKRGRSRGFSKEVSHFSYFHFFLKVLFKCHETERQGREEY